MQLDLGRAMQLGRLGLPGASRPTHEQRFARAMQDLDALEYGEQEHTGIAWLYNWLKDKFDLAVLWCVDIYTGVSFWLHSKYPRGYLLLFFGLSMFGSAVYVYDIYTDFAVATILLDNGLITKSGVVFAFILFHYVVISFMLGVKFFYHFEAKVINTIDRLTFPWDPKSRYSIHDTVQQQEVDAFLKSLTSSTVQLSSRPPQNTTMVETTQDTLLLGLSKVVRAVLKSVTFLMYCLILVAVTPFLDLAMMGLELLGGSVVVHAKSSITKNVLAFQNFLLQYETLRVPSRSYLESIPQTAYQGYLYATLKDDSSLHLDTQTLAQSIAISIFSAAKNTIEIWIAYKVSGFSFWSYVNNAILFEGAATLPFRWNAKRSSMLDRLVLGGDFYTLAHAQKMKLFQAALQHRKSITITTEEAKALGEECVVVASSLTMLEFIANMLPVSLSEQHASSAAIHIDITDIKNLPWRDNDSRTISRERALKVLFNMHESLMAFINVPMIWQKLEVVRMVNCNLPEMEEELDYGGLGELLLRSRVKVLEMSHTKIKDTGLKALMFGLVGNCSLVQLGLAGTGITANGARQLLQGLKGHDTLAELDVSLNHLQSEGAQHLARLIVTLPSLQQLHVAAVGMKADGLQALSMQASYAPRLRVLNMSANPDAFATPEAMDLLVTLLMRAPHGLHLHVGHCKLDSARVEALCRGGMVGKRGLRGLGLSGNAISRQGVESFCEALWSRVQRDRYALGLPELPPYVPYQTRVHAMQDEAAAFYQQRRLERMKTCRENRRRGSLNMRDSQPLQGLGPVPSEIKLDQTSSSGRTGSVFGAKWKRLLSLTNMDSHNPELYLDKDKGGPPVDNAGESSDDKEGHVQEYPLLADSNNKAPRKNRSKSVTFALMANKINELGSRLRRTSAQPEGLVTSRREGSETSNQDASVPATSSGQMRQASMLWFRSSVPEGEEGAEEEAEPVLLPPTPAKLQRTYVVLLELCGCGLRKDDVDELCHVLSEAPGLAVLDLSHNSELGNDALSACAHLIGGPQQSTMTKLRLVNCGLSAAGLCKQGVSYTLSSLTEVDLSCNPLGDEGVNELCLDVLAIPFSKLQVLGLASVNMGMQGFNYLLEALAHNSCLQRLNLSNNFIGGFQTQLYELFQSKNKTLKLMDLRHNQLSYEWCMVLLQIAEMGLGRVIQL